MQNYKKYLTEENARSVLSPKLILHKSEICFMRSKILTIKNFLKGVFMFQVSFTKFTKYLVSASVVACVLFFAGLGG